MQFRIYFQFPGFRPCSRPLCPVLRRSCAIGFASTIIREVPRYDRMTPAQTPRYDATRLTPSYTDHNLLALHSEQFLTSHQYLRISYTTKIISWWCTDRLTPSSAAQPAGWGPGVL